MQPVDIVAQYYLKYGADEAACVREYNAVRSNRKIQRQIKKIAIYNQVIKFGGIGRVITQMLPLYKKMGYEVIVITEEKDREDYEIPESIRHYVITSASDIMRGIKSIRMRLEQLGNIFEQEEVDLIVYHSVYMPFFIYDIIFADLCGIYTVGERHQVFSEEFCRFGDLFYVQAEAFKMLDKLIVLSNMDVSYWKSLGINAMYIENPFNTKLLDIKRNLNEENIVWVGRLDPNQKQYLDVIKIAKIVVKERPNVKFIMYGHGDDINVTRLNKAILDEKLCDNVIYCGFTNDIHSIYQNARIHLVTSAYEAFAMGIFESRICGIPLVMYELPYLELLKKKKGYLCSENGDIYGMAKNICLILEDKNLEEKLSMEAKESILGFNNEIICDKWQKLFNEIEQGNQEKPESQEFGFIIKTMHKHFAIAQKEYERLLCTHEQEKIIFNAKKGKKLGKDIVICPYGNIGKKVKKLLNEQGIYEKFILDNNLSKTDKSIVSYDKLREMDCSDLFFIICTKQNDIKQLFYSQLLQISKEDNIVCYDEIVP